MSDPNLALWLYIAIIFMIFLASPTWRKVYVAVTDATKAKAAQGASGGTQDTGAGAHTT